MGLTTALIQNQREGYGIVTSIVKKNGVHPGIEWVTSPYIKGRCGGVICFADVPVRHSTF
jgi:hypothetical protein